MKHRIGFWVLFALCCLLEIIMFSSRETRVKNSGIKISATRPVQTTTTITDAKHLSEPAVGFENSTFFTEHSINATSSLLVVESWESTPVVNDSLGNPSLTSLNCESEIVTTNDYSFILLGTVQLQKRK